ncbi:MAG TPA: sodium:proton exchanger [Treponema sp.]|nr:sodium:proton exchanger [Treponema sp.]
MNGTDPLAELLPQAFHFTQLHGTQLVLLLGIVMFFGAIGGRLFQKLKIPQVVGYIVIGILIGSSGFQIIRPETIAALDPVNSIALALIGFLVGAELKLDVIKKYGKQFVGVLLGESITPFFIVGILVTVISYAFTHNVPRSIALGLLLGAICSATAPAATTDVLKEYRTRGPLTTMTFGIVAMDDAVALILYAIASTIAAPLLGGTQISLGRQLLDIAIDIFGSIGIGAAFGFIISMIIKNLMKDEGRVLSFALGGLLLSSGICLLLGLDNILASMSVGFFLVNFAPARTKPVFKLVDKFTPPIYVLFFVLVGAKLNIWNVSGLLALIAITYVLGRTIGKTIGSTLGARLTKAPATVRKYLPLCLFSQAGVAIGLSIAASNDFPTTVGPDIILIITATTFIVQLIGPVCVKRGVTKAGEVGLDVTPEDILKSSFVKDVSWAGEPVCSANNPAVVSETATVAQILESFGSHHNQSFAVSGADGTLVGIITLDQLRESLALGEVADSILAMDIMEEAKYFCRPDMTLPDVYNQFDMLDTEAIPVVDAQNKPIGVVEKFTVDHFIRAQSAMRQHTAEKLAQQ